MAMYYYASKISAIACGTRCKQTVLQKSRGQRDRDKYNICIEATATSDSPTHFNVDAYVDGTTDIDEHDGSTAIRSSGIRDNVAKEIAATLSFPFEGMRLRRRYSEQHLDAYDIDRMGFQRLEVSTAKSSNTSNTKEIGEHVNIYNDQLVQYDVPRNTHKRSYCDVNYESSVLGSGGIMYINGKIVSGPLESLIEILVPKNSIDFDKDFIFSFLLSSRLFLRPHELLGKLLSAVPDCESSESLVSLLAEWTNKFPYDFRDERMMNHVKHIVARCSNTHFEDVVSQILSALLKRLTDLERHEADLRACQTNNENCESNALDCATAPQYAQILCRLEKKLAKHIGPEEFLQCSSNILLDKQKKWDQPLTSIGPPGAQDPKKTCNLETYLDWSARLRLFVCNEILQCGGIHDRSKIVELWSGVAQYCLLVGNYNSATAILESLESPPIARLKITWSKLQVTCQQLDCMQRHAEGHGDLWHKQAIVLNENHQKTDSIVASAKLQTTTSTPTPTPESEAESESERTPTSTPTPTPAISVSISVSASVSTTTTTTATSRIMTPSLTSTNLSTVKVTPTEISRSPALLCTTVVNETAVSAPGETTLVLNSIGQANNFNSTETDTETIVNMSNIGVNRKLNNSELQQLQQQQQQQQQFQQFQQFQQNLIPETLIDTVNQPISMSSTPTPILTPATATIGKTKTTSKSNDWVVIPVFADIVKLALTVREECLQRLPNGHVNFGAFDRLAAIVGAFTKHMHAVKSASEAPLGEYEKFCRHMQKTLKFNETELMMASFSCEEPNNAEKLMYDLN